MSEFWSQLVFSEVSEKHEKHCKRENARRGARHDDEMVGAWNWQMGPRLEQSAERSRASVAANDKLAHDPAVQSREGGDLRGLA